MIARETVLVDVLQIIDALMGDWELESEVTKDSWVLRDLGLESIDAVALGSQIAEKYGRELPFAEFFISVMEQRSGGFVPAGEPEPGDFTVGELVDFMTRELNAH